MDTRRWHKRRWTLGSLMILIALIAVPLALYARRPKVVEEYPERAAWQALAERRVKQKRNGVSKAQKIADESHPATPKSRPEP